MARIRFRAALAVLTLFALAVLAPGGAHAVSQARIFGSILDENKTPLAGVTIVVTCPEVPSLRLESKSDAAGKWAVTLVDSTKSHHYRFEKEGHQPMEMDLKLPIGSNERRDITLRSAQAVVEDAVAGESTPANNAAVRYNEGVEALRMGDDSTALAKFNEALAQNPQLMEAHSALAIVHMNAKRWPEAAAAAEKVLATDPKDEKALRVAVESYKALGDKEKLAAAQAALGAVDPATAAVDLYNQGVNAYNSGDMSKALGFFKQSAEKNADFARVHYMIGMCLVAEGKNAEAKAAMEAFIAKAAADDPDLATAKEMMAFLK
jgi:tetratricopeptide (TPR) repeat protein